MTPQREKAITFCRAQRADALEMADAIDRKRGDSDYRPQWAEEYAEEARIYGYIVSVLEGKEDRKEYEDSN